MLSSIAGQQSSNILASLSPAQITPSGSTDPFTEQLAAALEGYLGQSGNGSQLEIDIQKTQSQNSGVSQFIVTVKNPAGSTAQAAAAASSTATSSSPASASPAAASPASASASAPADTTDTQPADPMAEIDAYWAAQPPAVQQLRNVADFGQRNIMAQNLADQGYSIDRAIMVWGWDPMKTMATRQMYGYTWVPNYNQAGPSAAPGMALAGETPYDAGNPPPGSIAVNTAFASGLNITDPLAS